jgi:hypothetical protein
MPRGVAALPKPNRFADTLAEMASSVSRLREALGKRIERRGRIVFASAEEKPQIFIASITPVQRHSAPAIDIERVIAAAAPSMAAAETSPIFPVTSPKTKESIAIIAHIHVIAMSHHYLPFQHTPLNMYS